MPFSPSASALKSLKALNSTYLFSHQSDAIRVHLIDLETKKPWFHKDFDTQQAPTESDALDLAVASADGATRPKPAAQAALEANSQIAAELARVRKELEEVKARNAELTKKTGRAKAKTDESDPSGTD